MKYRFEPVPGKPHTFRAFDKETGEPWDPNTIIDQVKERKSK